MKNYYISAPFSMIENNFNYACNATTIPYKPAKLHLHVISIRIWARTCNKVETSTSTPYKFFAPIRAVGIKNFFSNSIITKMINMIILLISIPLFSNGQEVTKVNTILPYSVSTTRSVSSGNFTWTGTDAGIEKKNLKNEETIMITTDNSPLPSNRITCICKREDGNIWIGTSKGIVRYDGYAYLLINTENSPLPGNSITSMIEDKKGDIWIGTAEHGIVRVHRNQYTVYDHKNSVLCCDNISTLSLDETGEVVVQVTGNYPSVNTSLITR